MRFRPNRFELEREVRRRPRTVVADEIHGRELIDEPREDFLAPALVEVPTTPEWLGIAQPESLPRGMLHEASPRILLSCFWCRGKSTECSVPYPLRLRAIKMCAEDTPDETPLSTTCSGWLARVTT